MKTSYRTGLGAEALCRLALRLKFYRVLASRYRSPLGEIDIVAMRGKTVALVEVKARATEREPPKPFCRASASGLCVPRRIFSPAIHASITTTSASM